MKKIIRLLVGAAALVLCFFALDDSGIGFKKNCSNIKKWASGESDRLRIWINR